MRRLTPLVIIALLALLSAASAKECVEASAQFTCNDGSGSCSGLSADCQEEYGCRCTIEEVQAKFNSICTTSFSGSEFLNTYNNVYPCQPPTVLLPDGGHGAGAYASRHDGCDICGFAAYNAYGEQVYYDIQGAHTPDEYLGYYGTYSPFIRLCVGYGSPETCYSLYANSGSVYPSGVAEGLISCGLDCFGNCIPMTSQSAGCTYKCEEPSKTDDNSGPYCRKSAHRDYDTGQLIERDDDNDGYYFGSTVYVRNDCPFDIPEWIDLKPCDCNDEDPQVQQPEPEICDDGIDNDCDRKTDCCDDDCRYPLDPYCQAETECDDGIDNDCDLTVDCCGGEVCTSCGYYGLETCCYQSGGDPDCQGNPACEVESNCYDGVDNDCDNLIDCCDPDCEEDTIGVAGMPSCYTWVAMAMLGATCTPAVEDCTNGVDDDSDGDIDCDDSDCRDSGNRKADNRFLRTTVFFADQWRDYLKMVSVSFTQQGMGCPIIDEVAGVTETMCEFPLIYGEAPTSLTVAEKEPEIFLNAQYGGNPRTYSDADYLDYWQSFERVVVVEDFQPFDTPENHERYKMALLASEVAAIKNVPLIFTGDPDWQRLLNELSCKKITLVGTLSTSDRTALTQAGHTIDEEYITESNAQYFVRHNLPADEGVVLINVQDFFETDADKNPYPDLSLLAPQYALNRGVVIAMVDEPLLETIFEVPKTYRGTIDWDAILPFENQVRQNAIAVESSMDAYLESIYAEKSGLLAILASPEAVPMTRIALTRDVGGIMEMRISADSTVYAKGFNGVGRIFAFEYEMTSSYIQRALFLDYPDETAEALLMAVANKRRGDFEIMFVENVLSSGRTLENLGWNTRCLINDFRWNLLDDFECETENKEELGVFPDGHTEMIEVTNVNRIEFFTEGLQTASFFQFDDHGGPMSFKPILEEDYSGYYTPLPVMYNYPMAYSQGCSNVNYYRGGRDTIGIRWLEMGGIAFFGHVGIASGYEPARLEYAFTKLNSGPIGTIYGYSSEFTNPLASDILDFTKEITIAGILTNWGDPFSEAFGGNSFKADTILMGDPFISVNKPMGFERIDGLLEDLWHVYNPNTPLSNAIFGRQ